MTIRTASSRKQLLEFFHHSLSSFQSSSDPFRVLCTLPHHDTSSPSPRQPTRPLSRLIILDSSYNPPTIAHEAMVTSALKDAAALRPDPRDDKGGGAAAARVMLLLAITNADKAPKPASFPHRLCMMEALAQDLMASLEEEAASAAEAERRDLEVDLAVTKVPYFHDKSLAIQRSGFYGTGEGMEQVFLAGFDTLIRVFNPKYYGSGQADTAAVPGSRSGGMRAALGPLFAASRLRVTVREDDEWGSKEDQLDYLRKLRGGALEEVGGDVDWLDKVDMVDGYEGRGVSSSRVRDTVQEGGDAGKMVSEGVKAWIDEEGLYVGGQSV